MNFKLIPTSYVGTVIGWCHKYDGCDDQTKNHAYDENGYQHSTPVLAARRRCHQLLIYAKKIFDLVSFIYSSKNRKMKNREKVFLKKLYLMISNLHGQHSLKLKLVKDFVILSLVTK